jgi:dihydrofolate synthase/folylpolyglutamate synthase
MASRIARELGIPEAARREGLERTKWAGRYERIEPTSGTLARPWLLDGAHNPDGARSLVLALADEGITPAAIVFGALADKQWREMIDVLAFLPCPRVYVAPRGRAAIDPATLAGHSPGAVAASLPEGLELARKAASSETAPIVVCGSLYLVGEARGLLLDLPSDPPVAF